MNVQLNREEYIESIRKNHGTVFVIDIGKIVENYRWLKSIFPKGVVPVLKADAYGLGAVRVLEALYKEGAKSIMLHNLDEVHAIDMAWQRPKDLQVYLLGHTPVHCYEATQRAHAIPTLKSIADIESYSTRAKAQQTKLPCLLQIELGLNRLGISKEEQAYIIKHKEVLQHLYIHCIYGHLANAYDYENHHNEEQKKRYQDFIQHFPEYKQSLIASQGIGLAKEYHYDFTRIGGGLYGLYTTPHPRADGLENVLYCYSSLIHVHTIESGEKVGYGGIWIAKGKTTLGTITMGYGDGLPREMAFMGGYAIIEGVRCPYVGNISMDLAVIDITALEKKYQVVGQRVEIIGDRITPNEIARYTKKPPPVLLTGLKKRYPWLYGDGNKIIL